MYIYIYVYNMYIIYTYIAFAISSRPFRYISEENLITTGILSLTRSADWLVTSYHLGSQTETH